MHAPPLRFLTRALAMLLALCTAACSIVNQIDACGVVPEEFRVNQAADGWEVPSTARAAAGLPNSRLLVAFVASSAPDNPEASAVRIALLDETDGTRLALCSSGDLEATLTDSSVLAGRAVAVGAPFGADSDAPTTVAAVGWLQGTLTQSEVRVLFLDLGGCPISPGPFRPGLTTSTALTGLALAWSPALEAVVATYHDGHRIYRSILTGPGTTDAVELAQADMVLGQTVTAIDEEGRMLVVWEASTIPDVVESRSRVYGLLFDAEGDALPTELAGGTTDPFVVPFEDEYSPPGSSRFVSAAAGDGRFAVAADPSVSAAARIAVHALEIDAETGGLLGEPWRVDPDTGEGHGNPSLLYLPDDTLLVAWESTTSRGTLARLFDRDRQPRFNSMSCDDGRFEVGARLDEQSSYGTPSAVLIRDSLFIVRGSEPAYDSTGSGVVAWSLPFDALWPAR